MDWLENIKRGLKDRFDRHGRVTRAGIDGTPAVGDDSRMLHAGLVEAKEATEPSLRTELPALMPVAA